MLIDYARVSKTDGSQSLDLQRATHLRAAGIDDAANLYHDLASGVRDDRPGLAAGRLVLGIFAALAEFERVPGARHQAGDALPVRRPAGPVAGAGPEGPRILKPEDRDAGAG